MRIKTILTITIFVSAAIFISGVSVAQSNQELNTQNPKVIDKTVFKFQENIVINDLIKGDLYCLGNSVSIVGIVEGDIICAANKINITGRVNGDVRVFANDLIIDGDVSNNISAIANRFSLNINGTVGVDSVLLGANLIINGAVGRDVVARGGDIIINGDINRDLVAYYGNLNITSNSTIGGNVEVFGTNRNSNNSDLNNISTNPESLLSWIVASSVILIPLLYIIFFLTLMLAALLLSVMFPKSLQDCADYTANKLGTTLLTGLVYISLSPLIVTLLSLSIIGIPMAIVMILFSGILFLLCFPFVAHSIGNLIFPHRSHPIRALAGSVLLLIMFSIPFINAFTLILVVVLGYGLIIRLLFDRYKDANSQYKNQK
ncbi:MAG: hypothetical protein MUF85_00865 [Patescibacteria group bacterium]|jgi:hypothetical protein|nr:hypothetical protein [Patescibacteria group bacterium]